MIYLDTSVALAQLLAEDRCPPVEFWSGELIASRLIEYEIWNAIHRRRLERSHGDAVRHLIESIPLVELHREVLRRAVEPFPAPVRTLDALHLSTLLFLVEQGVAIELATYDRRMMDAAEVLEIDLAAC